MKKLLLSLVAILIAINVYAQPSTISYQGVLTDNSGALISGTPNITFALYGALENGNQLWSETKTGVSIANGLFQVELGSGTAFGSLNFAQDMWLQITVDGTTLTPRVKFNANGYSIKAGAAQNLSSASTITIQTTANDADINLIPNGSGQVYASGIMKLDQLDIGTAGSEQSPFLYMYDPTDNGGTPRTTSPTIVIEGTGKMTLGNEAVAGEIEISSGNPDIAGWKNVRLKANDATESYTLTLPANDGDNGQVLTTNGSGTTSWTTPSGGTSPTIIQQTFTNQSVNCTVNPFAVRLNLTVTGAQVGDAVIVNCPNLSALGNTPNFTSNFVSIHAWVSAANTVTVQFGEAGASYTQNNLTIIVTVIRPNN